MSLEILLLGKAQVVFGELLSGVGSNLSLDHWANPSLASLTWLELKSSYHQFTKTCQTCFKLPDTLFQVVPSGVSRQEPFRYQILSLTSTPQTWPIGLTEICWEFFRNYLRQSTRNLSIRPLCWSFPSSKHYTHCSSIFKIWQFTKKRNDVLTICSRHYTSLFQKPIQ